MRQIEVSTAVFAHIWALREEGEESEDSILKRVLPPIGRPMADRGLQKMAIAGDQKGEGKMRWVDDIVTALKRLGGEATLDEIYRTTKMIRQSAGRSLPRTFEAVVRRTLEDHSSDSANYRAENLFKLAGRGVWGLR